MSNFVTIDISSLKDERNEIITIFKKQLDAFHYIKKEIERVEWSDPRYDALVESVNTIGQALSSALQTITNGINVYVISELIPYANDYLVNEHKFPII